MFQVSKVIFLVFGSLGKCGESNTGSYVAECLFDIYIYIYTGQVCRQVDERLHSRCEYVFAQEGKGEETSMDAGLSVYYNSQACTSCVC